MPIDSTDSGSKSSGFPLIQVTLLLLGVGWSCHALNEALERRVPLSWYLGELFPTLTVGLGVSVVLLTAALYAVLRRFSGGCAPIGLGRFIRGLIYALMTGAIAFVVACQPFRTLLLEFAASLALGVFALGVLLSPRLKRLVRSGGMRRLDFALITICLILILSESSLRVLARFRPSAILSRATDAPEVILDAHRYPPGFVRMGFACNAGGYYDSPFEPKPAGEQLVVAIGDSFSAGVVPHHYHYTTVAERRLDCRVDNLGLPSIGPAEYMHLLVNEALPLKPDVVVISLFIGNDISAAKAGRKASFLEDWLDRDGLLVVQVPRRLSILWVEARERSGHMLGEMRDQQVMLESISALQARYPWVLDHSLEGPTMSRDRFLSMEIRRAASVCGSELDSYQRLFGVLEQIIQATAGTKLIFMLIPDQFQVEDFIWRDVIRTASGAEGFRRDLPQEMIGAWLDQRGVSYLDLLPKLRSLKVLPDGMRHCYHQQDSHFNALGNEVAGASLAEALRPLLEQ